MRASDIRRKAATCDRTKTCAALMLMLASSVDSFSLTGTADGVKLTVCKEVLKQEFRGKTLFDLVQPLGDWLVKLPKTVW